MDKAVMGSTVSSAWRVDPQPGRDIILRIILFLGVLAAGFYFYGGQDSKGLPSDLRGAISDGLDQITGKSAAEIGQEARRSLTRDALDRKLRQYEALRGKNAEDLQDLVREGLLQKADLDDEWGRSLKVEVDSRGIKIRSAGPDGHFGTRDDWVAGD